MNIIDFDPDRRDDAGRAPEWQAARRTLAQAAPPERVEAALLQAFMRRHRKLPWYRRWSLEGVTQAAGVACAACALALAVAGLQPSRQSAPLVAQDGFLALVPAERIAAAQPQLKEADLSRQTLVQLGIPIVADAPNELVHAQLLVAASGEPLAIRLAVN